MQRDNPNRIWTPFDSIYELLNHWDKNKKRIKVETVLIHLISLFALKHRKTEKISHKHGVLRYIVYHRNIPWI